MLLALAWAGYLIPKALRHSDEAARTRSIDRFSPSTRVLARREPVSGTETELVVGPSAGGGAPVASSLAAEAVAALDAADPVVVAAPAPPAAPVAGRGAGKGPTAARAALAARRRAARSAARRRRWILGLLLLASAAVGTAAGLRYAPVWAPAVPGALTLAYLVLCRTQVRRSDLSDLVAAAQQPAAGVAVTIPVQSQVTVPAQATGPTQVTWSASVTGAGVAIPAQRTGSVEPLLTGSASTEDTGGLSVAALREALSMPVTGDEPGSTLWDPLPVTLPTYVTKPRARRTVRTIDLGEPGTWTSGRIAEDAELAARATDPAVAGAPAGQEGRRAVGS